MILDVSAGPQSLTMHVVTAPFWSRVTRTTVPFGIVVWAHVPSGALNHDATPLAEWVPNGFCAGVTGPTIGRTTATVVGTTVVDGGTARTVVGVGGEVVTVVVEDAGAVGAVGAAGAGALVVDVDGAAGAATSPPEADVVDVTFAGVTVTVVVVSSETTRDGSSHVAGGASLRSNSGRAESPPSPRRTMIGTRRTDAKTPAA